VRNAATNNGQEARIRRSYRALLPAAIALCAAATGFAGTATELARSAAGSSPELERLHDALSPGRDIDSIAAVHTVGRIESDARVVGRVETWAQREPRLLRDVLEMEGVRVVVTIVGDDAWLEDGNGAVRELTGAERTSALLSHELLFHDYLDGRTPPYTVVVQPTHIRFLPPDDSPAPILGLSVDATSGAFLPVSWTERQQGMDVVTTFEDWRTIDGVRVPFVSTQRTGDPRFDLTRRTVTFSVLDALADDVVVAPRISEHADVFFLDETLARTIPIDVEMNLVFVDVFLDGRPGRFLLDTGAGSTIVAREFAQELGLEERGIIEARGAGGNEQAGFVAIRTLSAPGVELRDQTIVSMPLGVLEAAFGRPVDGILGYDFLSRFAVEIDYPRRSLSLVRPGTYRPRGNATRIPLTIEANIPRVPGGIAGYPMGLFIFDTGNSRAAFLHTPFLKRHGLEDTLHARNSSVSGIGGSEYVREGTVDSLVVGDVSFLSVPVSFSTSDDGVLAIDEAIGNLGGALFADGVLAFDYSEGALWVALPSTAARASDR
jgi:hypothetical protein